MSAHSSPPIGTLVPPAALDAAGRAFAGAECGLSLAARDRPAIRTHDEGGAAPRREARAALAPARGQSVVPRLRHRRCGAEDGRRHRYGAALVPAWLAWW